MDKIRAKVKKQRYAQWVKVTPEFLDNYTPNVFRRAPKIKHALRIQYLRKHIGLHGTDFVRMMRTVRFDFDIYTSKIVR